MSSGLLSHDYAHSGHEHTGVVPHLAFSISNVLNPD